MDQSCFWAKMCQGFHILHWRWAHGTAHVSMNKYNNNQAILSGKNWIFPLALAAYTTKAAKYELQLWRGTNVGNKVYWLSRPILLFKGGSGLVQLLRATGGSCPDQGMAVMSVADWLRL